VAPFGAVAGQIVSNAFQANANEEPLPWLDMAIDDTQILADWWIRSVVVPGGPLPSSTKEFAPGWWSDPAEVAFGLLIRLDMAGSAAVVPFELGTYNSPEVTGNVNLDPLTDAYEFVTQYESGPGTVSLYQDDVFIASGVGSPTVGMNGFNMDFAMGLGVPVARVLSVEAGLGLYGG
jgi:hypothetical protein